MKHGVKGRQSAGSGRPSETRQMPVRGKQHPPKMPRNLGKYAKQVWELAIESLPDVLRPLDGPILTACAEAYQMAMQCRDALRTNPADDKMQNAMCRALRVFESHAKQIGLTPSSRRIVKPVDPSATEEPTPFDDWMKRGGLN